MPRHSFSRTNEMIGEQQDIFLFIRMDKWSISKEGNKELKATKIEI